MTKQVQFRRGTTAQHTTFTGALAEVTVDTDLDVVVVHDGSTVGGQQMVGRTATQTLTNKTLTSPTVTGGSINNTPIGATTRGTGAFTTLDANSTVGLSPANNSVTISPTGTGTVTLNPATAGTINNMSIGATTRNTGAFTTLNADGNVTLGDASADTVTVNGTTTFNAPVSFSGGTSHLTLTGELRGPATFILDPAAVGDDTGTVEIKGNLTVQGTTTTINSTTSVLADPVIELRRGTSITAADGGIQVNLTTNGSAVVTGFQRIQWNNSSTRWETTDGTTAKPIVNTVDSQTIAGEKTFSDNAVFNANVTLGNAASDTITVTSQFVTGTQLKTAQANTNTLNLAAYDVDGTAYTNLITLTASNTPTLELTSTGVGTINNMSIGATTRGTGAFTTLDANSTVGLSPANNSVTISPTGTGIVTLNPAAAGTINNMSIGATIKASGAFTTLAVKDTSANFDVTFSPVSSVALTANRALTFDVINTARTIKLAGNIDLANNLTTSGNFALTLTSTAATNVTLPTTGTLLTTAGSGSSLTFGTGSLSLAGNLTTSGAFAVTLTSTAATNVTLPTTGTLATLTNTTFVGTTSIALNRASAELALTGITGFSTVAATGANSTGISIITGSTTTSGNSGDVNIDVGVAATTLGVVNIATTNATTVNVGSTSKNTTLNVRGNGTAGTAILGTNVTTGIVNLFTGVTGTINIGTSGTAIIIPEPRTASSAATQRYVDVMAIAMGL